MTGKIGGTQPHHLLIHERAAELLGDGQWHDLEGLITALVQLVPAPIALREAERRRRERYGDTQRIKAFSREDQIRGARRALVLSVLRGKIYEVAPVRKAGVKTGPPQKIRKVGEHRNLATRGDPYRVARDKLTLEVERQKGVIEALAKLAADHGLGGQAEAIIEKRKRKR